MPDTPRSDIAKQKGNTPIVDLLVKSGACGRSGNFYARRSRDSNNTIRSAIEDSLPLLQRADANFSKNAACFSCHNNSMAAMAMGLARKRGLRIDEPTAAAQVRFNVEALEALRDKMHQGYVIPEGDVFSDFVLGLPVVGASRGKLPSPTSIRTLPPCSFNHARKRTANGLTLTTFPPADLPGLHWADGLAMRALQFYAPKTAKAECEKSVRLRGFLAGQGTFHNNEDRSWRLIGPCLGRRRGGRYPKPCRMF